MSLTPVANEKILNQKNFNNFVETHLDSRVNIYINFCLQVHFKVSAAYTVPLIVGLQESTVQENSSLLETQTC